MNKKPMQQRSDEWEATRTCPYGASVARVSGDSVGDFMIFEILPDDFEERVQRAIANGGSGDCDVLGELAKRFPRAKFHRQSLPHVDTERTFEAKDVLVCYEERIEMRPSVDATGFVGKSEV